MPTPSPQGRARRRFPRRGGSRRQRKLTSDMAKAEQKNVRITLKRSLHGRLRKHRACVRGLGLRRIHQTVTVPATPENLGMVRKVSYMLDVEELN